MLTEQLFKQLRDHAVAEPDGVGIITASGKVVPIACERPSDFVIEAEAVRRGFGREDVFGFYRCSPGPEATPTAHDIYEHTWAGKFYLIVANVDGRITEIQVFRLMQSAWRNALTSIACIQNPYVEVPQGNGIPG